MLNSYSSEDEDVFIFVDKLQRLARKTYECLAQQQSSDLKLAAQLYDACVEVKDYLDSTNES